MKKTDYYTDDMPFLGDLSDEEAERVFREYFKKKAQQPPSPPRRLTFGERLFKRLFGEKRPIPKSKREMWNRILWGYRMDSPMDYTW